MTWDKDEIKKALASRGIISDPNSKLAQVGKRLGQDFLSQASGGLVAPSAQTAAVMNPASAMGAAPAPTREGGAVQEVGVGAQDVAAGRKKPMAVFSPGVSAEGPPAAADQGLSIKDIMNLGGRGSAGGWQQMEAAPVKQAYGQAFDAAGNAINAETAANVGMSRAEADAARAKAGVMMQARADAQAAEQNRQIQIQNHFAESQKLAQDVKDVDVDPDSYYGNGAGGVLKRAMLMIASSMGGYAAGLRGGPNTVQEAIDKDIDRFVQGQKMEYQKRAGLLQASDTRFGQLMQKFGDERAAESALKADLYGAAQAQGEGMLADAKGEQAQAEGQKNVAGLAMSKADYVKGTFRYAAPTAGMSPLEALKIKQQMEAGAADVDLKRAQAEKLRSEGGKNEPNPDLELAKSTAAGIGKGSAAPGVDLPGIVGGRRGVGDAYEMWDARLNDAAAQAIKLRGGRVNEQTIAMEKKNLFGDRSPAAIEEGKRKLLELARIKGGKGGGGGGESASDEPESFKE